MSILNKLLFLQIVVASTAIGSVINSLLFNELSNNTSHYEYAKTSLKVDTVESEITKQLESVDKVLLLHHKALKALKKDSDLSSESVAERKRLFGSIINHHEQIETIAVSNGKQDSSNSKFHSDFKNIESSIYNITMVSSDFTCESLDTKFDPTVFCSGVVDYPFIVFKNGYSKSALNSIAKSQGMYYNSFINVGCLSDVKRLICTTLYKPCVTGVKYNDKSTYELTEGVLLPYKRPCRSLCQATTATGTTCAGLLEAFGLNFDCSAIDSSTGLAVYDYLNTNACNKMISTINKQLVGSVNETYRGSLCKGIITDTYVPAAYYFNSSYSPLMSPHVTQAIVEELLDSILAFIPRYLVSDCLTSMRELYCTSFFLNPYPSEDLSFLFGTVYIPSYPRQDICTSYNEQCSYLISLVPATAMNCSKQTAGVKSYPTTTQTIVSLDLGYYVINMQSPPFSLDNITTLPTIASQCPYGLAIPDDPTKPGVQWIVGACALACPLPLYTHDEYYFLYNQYHIAQGFAVIMGIIHCIHIYMLKASKRNIFVICAVFQALLLTAINLFQYSFTPAYEALVCETNASWYSKEHLDSYLAQRCYSTSLISVVCGYVAYWSLLSTSFEIWFRVVKGMKDVKEVRRYYMGISAAVMFTNAMMYIFYADPNDMIAGSTPILCAWTQIDAKMNYYLYTLPNSIYWCTAILVFAHSIYTCLSISLRVKTGEKNPLTKIWKSYSMLFLFMGIFIVVYPGPIFYFGTQLGYIENEKIVQGAFDWLICLLSNFTTSDNDAYIQMCGNVPKVRVGLGLWIAGLVTFYTTPILLFFLTLNGDVKKIYWNLFISFMTITGTVDMLGNMGVNTKLFSSATTTRKGGMSSVADSEYEPQQALKTKKIVVTSANNNNNNNNNGSVGLSSSGHRAADSFYINIAKFLYLKKSKSNSTVYVDDENNNANDAENKGGDNKSIPLTEHQAPIIATARNDDDDDNNSHQHQPVAILDEETGQIKQEVATVVSFSSIN
eukprot:gene8373-11329_t